MMTQQQTPEELATELFEREQAEYRAAEAAVVEAIETNIGRTTITEVRVAIHRKHPQIKHRFINAALANKRGSLFYLESDGRITAPGARQLHTDRG